MQKKIVIKGAKEHNLKNIDICLPRDKFVVFTGLSGSGKSSLAFDTIYAEGQRRYVESLSSYARMFLGQMEKPDVESIEGISPAISIDQKTTSKNPRSTVGTVTEIYDYYRLLFARVGIPHCPVCGREIKRQTIDDIVNQIMGFERGTKLQIMAPIVRGRKGEYGKELENAKKQGFVRVRVDGNIYDLNEEIPVKKTQKHNIEIVVDRIAVKDEIRSRLADSVETSLKLAKGLVLIAVSGGEEMLFSENYSCPDHGFSMGEISPRTFSFNNPFGACKTCSGLGVYMKFSRELVIPDETLSLNDGAIKATGWRKNEGGTIAGMYFKALGEKYGFTLDTPVCEMSEEAVDAILYGTKGEKLKMQRLTSFGGGIYESAFEGVLNNLERRYRETASDSSKTDLEAFMEVNECPDCHGARLSDEALSVTVGGKNIDEICRMSVKDEIAFIKALDTEFNKTQRLISEQIIKEIVNRLSFLQSVGLEYLSLARNSGTLSGGESQRIRLATQIGSALTGVLYILDEPSIGLHQKDNAMLLDTLKKLRDLGNTLIVVEHDDETMMNADYIVDIGPGAGIHGGEIICAGTVEDVMDCEKSITGQYLSGKKQIPVPEKRRKGNGKTLEIIGARQNNLHNLNVTIPLGEFVCVTGVSGSGKSSLVNEILYKELSRRLNRSKKTGGNFDEIKGVEQLDKVICIDQSPIGRTPRSNPATYTGVFGDIRELFAQTQDAKTKGYTAGRFSFNVKGGRCEACQGDGIIKIQMHFLSDVYVPCEVCGGARYNQETLAVKYKGKNIFDVLEMTVEEGMSFFSAVPKIYNKLKTLFDVGLGYIKIGQPAPTLSGGEAQRVKLSTELAKRATGKTIYVLDEPTTGLHTADVHRLINVLQALVDQGNSLVVIEHNLDVIKNADYIIDLGPDGGDKGGSIVATGTPEQVSQTENSYTGQYLRKILKENQIL